MPRFPPGPDVAPLQTFKYLRDTFAYVREMLAAYGDPVCVPTLSGNIVITGDAAGARAIFTAEPDVFDAWPPGLLAPLLGARSLLQVGGPRHRDDRRLLAPMFHGARVRSYAAIMATAARRAVARLQPGEVFAMQDVTRAISMEVMLRAVFGIDDPPRIEQFASATIEVFARSSAEILFVPSQQRGRAHDDAWSVFLRAREKLMQLIGDVIDARRAGATGDADILDMLLVARYDDGSAMGDGDVRDELLTLLFAGYETTATALAWAMYWLHREPGPRSELLRELDALDRDRFVLECTSLPYLDAVCNESARLYPITADVVRVLRAPLAFKGYQLPAGCAVSVALSVLHMQDDAFPNPAAFRPQRFLERKFTPFEFAPFGGGSRRCLGSAFALHEMKIVLATLMREFRFRLAHDANPRPVRRAITFGPSDGIPMVLEGARVASPA